MQNKYSIKENGADNKQDPESRIRSTLKGGKSLTSYHPPYLFIEGAKYLQIHLTLSHLRD